MSKRKLLLADDSVTIQKVVNLTFADEGVDVLTFGDGDAAMEAINADRPNIVLADVNMPGLTGYQICERLRSDDATRDLPVILLVGSFEPFDEAEAARVGANAYLTKPFQSIRQLVAQVSELMDSAATTEPEAVAVEEAVESPPAEMPAPDIETEAQTEEFTFSATETASDAETAQPQNFDDLGYATSEPSRSAAAGTTDIDSLYDQSISNAGGEELSEIGIDDEMIETSYASGSEPDGELEAVDGSAAEPPADEADANETNGPTENLDLSGAAGTEPGAGDNGSTFYPQNQDDPSRFESTMSYDNWTPADLRETENEPVSETSPQLAEVHQPAAPSIGEETIRMDGRFDTTGSANFQFDEVNLLDLENAERSEVEITTPLDSIEQGSNKQVVSLSPQLIEMIAQRVVEKMSEKY